MALRHNIIRGCAYKSLCQRPFILQNNKNFEIHLLLTNILPSYLIIIFFHQFIEIFTYHKRNQDDHIPKQRYFGIVCKKEFLFDFLIHILVFS